MRRPGYLGEMDYWFGYTNFGVALNSELDQRLTQLLTDLDVRLNNAPVRNYIVLLLDNDADVQRWKAAGYNLSSNVKAAAAQLQTYYRSGKNNWPQAVTYGNKLAEILEKVKTKFPASKPVTKPVVQPVIKPVPKPVVQPVKIPTPAPAPKPVVKTPTPAPAPKPVQKTASGITASQEQQIKDCINRIQTLVRFGKMRIDAQGKIPGKNVTIPEHCRRTVLGTSASASYGQPLKSYTTY